MATGVRQDDGDGDDHHLAGAERGHLPEAQQGLRRAIFIVAPGITVKERLQVLYPGNSANSYDEFGLCPSEAMRQKLNQVAILVENWHTLMPLKETTRSVVKKGTESDKAFVRPRARPARRHSKTSSSSTTRRTTRIASPPT